MSRRILLSATGIALVAGLVLAPMAVTSWLPARRVAVLMYHDFAPGEARSGNYLVVSEADFRRQMQFLARRGYRTVTTEELREFVDGKLRLPAKPVLITVDDGYESTYTVMYRVLKEYGLRATLFERTGRADTPNHLTWKQMREMQASGVFEIASHSHEGHYRDTPLTYEFWRKDLAAADDQFVAHGLPRPKAFAYPMGRHNAEVIRALRDHGIQIAFLTTPGYVRPGDPPLELPRFAIVNTTTLREFALYVSGRYRPTAGGGR